MTVDLKDEAVPMMRRPWSTVVVVAALATACAGTGPAPTTESPGAPDSAVPEGVPLRLLITNQDFDRPSVDLTVSIDGDEVVNDDFAVEGQHNVRTFELEAKEGRRQLTVASDFGEEYSSAISLRDESWVLIQYWGDSDETFLVTIEEKPIGIE